LDALNTCLIKLSKRYISDIDRCSGISDTFRR
jgi:hypothetical protein